MGLNLDLFMDNKIIKKKITYVQKYEIYRIVFRTIIVFLYSA